MKPFSYRVTPGLWVGDVPLCGGIPTKNVEDAVGVIRCRERAVLPHGHWATALDVLRALGVDDEAAREKITFAQTASVG